MRRCVCSERRSGFLTLPNGQFCRVYVRFIMSLDTFSAHPELGRKKRPGRKREAHVKANAARANASQNNDLEPEDEAEYGTSPTHNEELSEQRDKAIVDCVTANVEKMLDRKLAHIFKPVSEVSEKLDSLIQRMGTVEQQVSDLEDLSTATAPRVTAVEVQLQKALDRLESYENQSRRQNVRIIGLKEAHRMGPTTRFAGKERPRAVPVRLHDYTDKQEILQAARNKGTSNIDGIIVSFYQDFSTEVVRKRKEYANARKQLREAGIW
ncbi:hypothetical protein F2P81_003960 [Scophthalmus maximus]|uniref:Uncharacterized protein n=1 Tax=Scophthalmus maximus TaxID=52904 RepID=A0A6A4TRY9_SCOMX|nr:hypothetical protein F2P81_003960 [Scophthalmus maximus]